MSECSSLVTNNCVFPPVCFLPFGRLNIHVQDFSLHVQQPIISFFPPVSLCRCFLLFLDVYFAEPYNSTGLATFYISGACCAVHYEYYSLFPCWFCSQFFWGAWFSDDLLIICCDELVIVFVCTFPEQGLFYSRTSFQFAN